MKLKEQKIMNDPIMNCKRDVVECECLCAVTAGVDGWTGSDVTWDSIDRFGSIFTNAAADPGRSVLQRSGITNQHIFHQITLQIRMHSDTFCYAHKTLNLESYMLEKGVLTSCKMIGEWQLINQSKSCNPGSFHIWIESAMFNIERPFSIHLYLFL